MIGRGWKITVINMLRLLMEAGWHRKQMGNARRELETLRGFGENAKSKPAAEEGSRPGLPGLAGNGDRIGDLEDRSELPTLKSKRNVTLKMFLK